MAAPREEDFKDPIDYWRATLNYHGWRPKRPTLWIAPDGQMFLGPWLAFKICRRLAALPVPAGEEPGR